MTEGPVPLVLVALIGLGIGVWLGMPGRDRQSAEDIERAMDTGTGRRKRTKRVFTPMAWLHRKADPRSSRSRTPSKKGFKLESPDDRD